MGFRVMMPEAMAVFPGNLVAALDSSAPPMAEPISDDDARRLERLFEHNRDLIWRFALRMTADRAEAEDLLQETFLRAATHRRNLPSPERAARAWLTRTLVNMCRDRARRGAVRRRYREALATNEPHPSSDPEKLAVARQQMDAALDELSPRRRAVLVLRELDGFEEAEVAELLGLRRATVRWHVAAARKHLRKRLEREED